MMKSRMTEMEIDMPSVITACDEPLGDIKCGNSEMVTEKSDEFSAELKELENEP